MSEVAPGVYDSYDEAVSSDPYQQLLNIGREIMRKLGKSWADSFNQALDENPDLRAQTGWSKFLYIPKTDGSISLIPPRQEEPADSEVANLASKTRAQMCYQVVKAVQTANPGLSYHESWEIAQAENKQLFQP